MRGHRRAHRGEHIGEHTYESTHMRAHVWEHRGAHIWGHAISGGHVLYGNIMKYTGKNAHGHVTRYILCGNLEENVAHDFRGARFVMKFQKKRTWTRHKSHLCGIYRKMPFTISGDHVLCGNLQEKTHMDMWHEPFCVEIYRNNAAHLSAHLDWTPGLNTHRKNPFSVATLFGEWLIKNWWDKIHKASLP